MTDKPLEEPATEEPKQEEAGGLDDDDLSTELTLISGGEAPPEKFTVTKGQAKLSKFITTVLEGDANATEIEVRQVRSDILEEVVNYLKHHDGKEPGELPCPVRSTEMKKIVHDEWDATYIDAFDKKKIFEIILGANYMDIKSLLHLGCAKIATLIKALSQEEINKIIEEEEKYRREHADETNKDEATKA